MTTVDPATIKKLVVACDAGMGSSAMLAGTLKKQLAKSGIVVEHTSVQAIPADADFVLTHAGLLDRARGVAGNKPVVPFNLFLGDPAVTKVVNGLLSGQPFDV